MTHTDHDWGVVKAKKEIIGVKVNATTGEDLGEIEEIVLNKQSGQVNYVVLSYGGILGMGDKLLAIPWNALHYDDDKDTFVLDVDKEKIKSAPSFDKDHWPNFADKTWIKTISDYYQH